MTRFALTITTPLGLLRLVGTETALTAVDILGPDHTDTTASADTVAPPDVLLQASAELGEYFAGVRKRFAVALQLDGSAFQHEVWAALTEIPFGTTCSYGELARRIGRPQASRAVGLANGRNPIAIVVPCHRVIGHNGALTGYAGGLACKQWLLEHERRVLGSQQSFSFAASAGTLAP